MLNALSNGRYSAGSSLLHRTDPRTKIVLTLLFTLGVFAIRTPVTLILLLLLCFGMAQHAGRPLRHSLRGLKPIVPLAVFTAIAHLLLDGGPALADSGILSHVSRDGAERSLMMILRLTVLMSGASLLTVTTTPLTLTDGLQRLMKPLQRLGVPVGEIAMMMTLSLRFIPVIAEESKRLIAEQSASSPHHVGGTLLQRARNCLPLILPLFAAVIRRGNALATAMDARCYGACQERTRMHPLRFSATDIRSGGVVLFFFLLLVYIDHFYAGSA
jgi:energy-coupling factor transport system permease protein